MSDEIRPNDTDKPGTEEASYVPASIYKRVWAWVGIVYMVILVLLVTYFLATWTFLTGIAGIMLFPALGGFCVVKAIQAKRMEFAADKVGPVIWSVVSGILCVVCLIWGIAQAVTALSL